MVGQAINNVITREHAQSTSIPMVRPSPVTRAVFRLEDLTFSLTNSTVGASSTAIGSTSCVDGMYAASRFAVTNFFDTRDARSFSRAVAILFFQKACSRRALISATRFMAFIVTWTRSRSYLTGTFRRFSNSNVESIVISFPAAFRKALVHFTFRGLRFILKFLWHFDVQKRKTLASFRTNSVPCPG